MSISLSCYCSEPAEKVAEALSLLKGTRSDLFVQSHAVNDPKSLSEPTPWNQSEKVRALEYGIAAKASVYISINRDHPEQVQEVADAIYDCLGPSKVVVTFQDDHIISHRGAEKA